MGQRLIQNFRGCRAFIQVRPGTAIETLEATLIRLGVAPAVVPLVGAALDPEHDVLFLDGDLGSEPVLPAGSLPPVPVIGLVGVEAPSRLKALMEQGATAFLRKPVHAGSVYSSLFLGINEFRRRRQLEQMLAEHDRRRHARRFLIRAIVELVTGQGMTDDEAYQTLRRRSMRERLGLEAYCEALFTRRDTPTEENQDASNLVADGGPAGGAGDGAGGAGGGADQAWRAGRSVG